MKYEPIKEKLGNVVGQSPMKRRILYTLLGLIFLREWHVKRALRRLVRQNRVADILDAGSGFGQYSYYAAKLPARGDQEKMNVLGVDINRMEIDKCTAFARATGMGNLTFMPGDLENLDFRERFDLIVSVDVMEHIRDDLSAFKNFHSALRKGGKILISTPSNFGGSDVHEEGGHSFIEEHFREGYSAEEMISRLGSAGLTVETIQYTYGRAGSWYWNAAIKVPVKMLNASFALILILPFYYLLALPFSLLFMGVDYFLPPKRGSGLLVIATKEN